MEGGALPIGALVKKVETSGRTLNGNLQSFEYIICKSLLNVFVSSSRVCWKIVRLNGVFQCHV